VPEPKGQGSVSGTAREVLGTSAVLDSAHLGLGMLALRGYRVIGAVLLVVKAVQLGSR
jgi:hypothetical protein